ncbi:hypothetical protein D9M71_258210 [compost metagenome]
MLLVVGAAVDKVRVVAVVVIILVVLEGTDTGTEDQRKRIGGTQARGDVGAALALVGFIVAILREVRFGYMTTPVEDVARHQGKLAGVPGIAGLPRGRIHVAHDQVVFAAEQAEWAGHVDIGGVLHPVAFPAAPIEEHAFTGDRVRVATTGRSQPGVMIGAHLVDAELERPVVGQCLVEGGEIGLAFEIPTTPVGTRIEGTGKVGARAIGKIHGITGPGRASGRGGLAVDTERQLRARGQVGFEDAVQHIFLLAVVVQVGVLVLIGPDKSPAQRGVIIQGTRDIAFGTVIVPGASAAGDRSLEIAGRFLAHQVDCGRRVA